MTPSVSNSICASGEAPALSMVGKSTPSAPCPSTGWPGRNFMDCGFGVSSVWMNITHVFFAYHRLT